MEYIAITKLTINGKDMSDFKSFTEEEVEAAMSVNLMNKTGTAEKTVRRKLNLEYVIPAGEEEYDWNAVKNATFTAEDEGGIRTTWTGVTRLTIGEAKVDGETEKMRTIVFQVTGDKIKG